MHTKQQLRLSLSPQATLAVGLSLLLVVDGGPLTFASGHGAIAADEVAARVNGQAIFASEVRRVAESVTGKGKLDPASQRRLLAETLTQLVKRQLAALHLKALKLAATKEEVNLALEGMRERLKQQGATLKSHLKRTKFTEDQLRRTLAWQIGWQRMLDRYMTDANLKRYFDRHRADFDGTEVRVSHILLKLPPTASADEIIKTKATATKLRGEIIAKRTTFIEAAKQHSAGSTASEGGEIGFIPRHKLMPEAFSKAAFALKPQQVSAPIRTAFGFHLIHCLEIKPGQKRWMDVLPALRRSVARYLLDWSADQQRTNANVEFTGKVPYLDPKSRRLVTQ